MLLGGILLVALLGSRSLAQGCCGPIQSDSGGISGGLVQERAEAPQKLELSQVEAILDDLIETSFQELKGIRYVLYTFKSKTIRFRSNFRLGMNIRKYGQTILFLDLSKYLQTFRYTGTPVRIY